MAILRLGNNAVLPIEKVADMLRRIALSLVAILGLGSLAIAGDRITVGGDQYASGFNTGLTDPSDRDAFLAGFSVGADARVGHDLDAAGLDVDIDAPVGRNLHVAGLSVKVSQPIGEDISGTGLSLRIRKAATIGGNARLLAGNLVLDAPVAGSVFASAATLSVNGSIGGDARLTARDLSFGPDAHILGTLTYFAPNEIQIPTSVISENRVHFQRMEMRGTMQSWRQGMPRVWPALATIVGVFVLLIAGLAATGGVLIAIAPVLVGSMRQQATERPFHSIGWGIVAIATTTGLIPLLSLTLIGIPLIPLVLLVLFTLWLAGYLLGVFAITTRIVGSFRPLPPTVAVQLTVLVAGLVVMALLNFIPFIGWLLNITTALLGVGAILSSNWHIQVHRRHDSPVAPEDIDSRQGSLPHIS